MKKLLYILLGTSTIALGIQNTPLSTQLEEIKLLMAVEEVKKITIPVDETPLTAEELHAKTLTNLATKPLDNNDLLQLYIDQLMSANQLQSTTFCTINDLQKLTILAGTSSKQTHSLKNIFATKTKAGELTKNLILANPITDASLLKTRQNRINFLLEHPEIRAALHTQLAIIQANEQLAWSYTKKLSKAESLVINAIYYKWPFFKKINTSVFATNTLNMANLLWNYHSLCPVTC